jgi:hypothetical protein
MDSATAQDSHHFVLTLQKPSGSGWATGTWAGSFTPSPGATRYEVYAALVAQCSREHPEVAGGAVVYFSLERNEL